MVKILLHLFHAMTFLKNQLFYPRIIDAIPWFYLHQLFTQLALSSSDCYKLFFIKVGQARGKLVNYEKGKFVNHEDTRKRSGFHFCCFYFEIRMSLLMNLILKFKAIVALKKKLLKFNNIVMCEIFLELSQKSQTFYC